MKRIIALFAISTLLLAANTTQAQKIAHINVDELLGLMPETQAAEKEMQNYAQQLERDLQEMQEDAQTKYQNLVNNQNNWTQLRITKEQEELETMAQRIQQYQVQAQQDLQDKQMELMEPIIEKAQNAVNDIAREKGYTYVLDSSQSKGVVIFVEKGEDILPLVKAKLGITTTSTQSTQSQN
jgi:outer membrane protein